jgi:hypothetical protein
MVFAMVEKKEADSKKSQPLLTYEKHRVKITLIKFMSKTNNSDIKTLFCGVHVDFFLPASSEIHA